MGPIPSHNRRFLIAGAAVLTLGMSAFGLALYFPALGPITGTIAPQFYVDSVAGAQIPVRGPFLLVDANSARLYMIEDGRVQDSMRVIVGKPDTPTPELKDVLNYETLNPYWHVPADLNRSLIAPNVLKQGTAYLTQHGYEVVSAFRPDASVIPPENVDWKAVADGTEQIHIREQPGPFNSLGSFKFALPHGDGIFLHDTPKKELFAQEQRNLSHGCVRLEDAHRLAKWLLGKDPPPASVPEDNVVLPRPVPITISYLDRQSQTQLALLR